MLQDINDMTEGNARVVFQRLNQLNEKYHRLFMNYTYDEKMTQLIEKYNAKINYFHNQKTK
jgi:DNA-binding GntR family transcriptional regulator